MAMVLSGLAQQHPIVPIPTDSVYYTPIPKPFRDSYTYIQGGLALPLGLYGELPGAKAMVVDAFRGNTGTGAAMGYMFEVGYRRAFVVKHAQVSRIYPFWGLAMGAGYNALDWTALGGFWKQQSENQFAQGAGLIHLGVALKHNAKWALEGHGGLLLPAVTFYPDNNILGSAERPTDFNLRVIEGSENWSPGFTVGLTWHTRHFRIGVEWFRHRSTLSYTYREGGNETGRPVEAFFDWQTARTYIGVQF